MLISLNHVLKIRTVYMSFDVSNFKRILAAQSQPQNRKSDLTF